MGWFLKVKFRYTFLEIKISAWEIGFEKRKKQRSLWLFQKAVKEKVWNTLAFFMITIQRLAVYWTSLYIMYWMLPPERNSGGGGRVLYPSPFSFPVSPFHPPSVSWPMRNPEGGKRKIQDVLVDSLSSFPLPTTSKPYFTFILCLAL